MYWSVYVYINHSPNNLQYKSHNIDKLKKTILIIHGILGKIYISQGEPGKDLLISPLKILSLEMPLVPLSRTCALITIAPNL